MTSKYGRQQPPIFILSCHRSGSTLLRYIIDTHPAISSPAELSLGALCERLYDAVYHTIGVTTPVATDAQRSLVTVDEVRRIVSRLMNNYVSAKGTQFWCEKTPMNLNHLDMLSAVFPDARYICLYRNCMDVVYSILEFNRIQLLDELLYFINKNAGNVVNAIIDYWIAMTEKELSFEQQIDGRCFRVTYESLVLNPAATLKPMFEFLEVKWDDNIIESVFSSRHDPGKGDPKASFSKKINRSSLGKGSSVSRSFISDGLEPKMNALLYELGYPLVGPDWDSQPSFYNGVDSDENGEVLDVKDVFVSVIPDRIKKHSNRLPTGTTKIIVTGNGGGVWLIRPGGQIVAGEGDAECVITISARDLLALVSGSMNAAAAFDQGKLRIAGDGTTANVLGGVLFGG